MKRTTHYRSWWPSGLLILAVAAGISANARAEHARFYNLEGFGTWLDGNPESTAVTEDGAIVLPMATRERYADAAANFSAATAWGDEIVVARVDDARVLAIDRAGKERELFKAEQSMVTALLATAEGLLVAAGPPARIYRVDAKGRSKLFHSPDAGYVWSMASGTGGSVFLATGEPGTVVRVDGSGNGKVLFEPEQEHLRSLAVDESLGILVGGGEKGILYRSPLGKTTRFSALYDSGHTEVTSVVTKGAFAYVAGVSGAQALAEADESAKPSKSKGPEVRSQLVQVAMDGTAEVLAGSSDEAIFDLAVNAAGLIVASTGATGRDDPRGRLYTVDPGARLIAMTYQSASRRITHLVELPRGALAAVSGGGGRITHLSGGLAKKGEFLTMPHDVSINARFGIVQIFGAWPKNTRVTAAVRTGQTATPDDSWSPWSKEITAPGPRRPKVTNGRYLQVRLTLTGNGSLTPLVYRVRLAYLRQNLRPFVREVVALRKGIALLPIIREESKSKTISLEAKTSDDARQGADKEKKKNGNHSSRARQVEQRGALTLKWVAEDPNGDALSYDLMVRNAGDGDWRTVDEELEQPFYTLESSQLPDGHYQFRVRASDKPSNPDGLEQSDTRESRAVLVDNSPPRVDEPRVTVRAGRVTVRTVVADAVGPLVEAGYSVDGEDFRPIQPDDGVLDGPGESFTLRLGALEAGPHSITVRVVDEGDNEGFGEARFNVP